MLPTGTRLAWRAGTLCVTDWPPDVPPPVGLDRHADALRGPPRLRRQVRERLAEAGVPFVDACGPEVASGRPSPPPPGLDPESASAFATWRSAGDLGILAGLRWPTRVAVLVAAVLHHGGPALLVVRDTAVLHRWQEALAGRQEIRLLPHGAGATCTAPCAAPVLRLTTSGSAARDMAWLGRTVDLLVLDDVDLLPAHHSTTIGDGCAALHRLGFANAGVEPAMFGLTAHLGPLVFARHAGDAAPRLERHVPMTPSDRVVHDDAWHRFLLAFDRFATLHPRPRFAAFVAWARADGRERPALQAWHRARAIAAWNTGKATVVAELLATHRGQRVLVFTPDRASAYQLARQHLIAPLTSELSRRERTRLLQQFASGELRVLVGPKLLDVGVEPGCAEVGIAVGGHCTAAELRARRQRVAPSGVFYQLIAQHTWEVSRARPEAAAAATATAVVHGGRR